MRKELHGPDSDFPIPPDIEGFWAWEKGHFPRPATPLTQEILYSALTDGFSRAMEHGPVLLAPNVVPSTITASSPSDPSTWALKRWRSGVARYQEDTAARYCRAWATCGAGMVARHPPRPREGPHHRLHDVEQRGLLHTLDEMLQDFRERWTIHGYINFVVISASWFADFYNETFEPEDPTRAVSVAPGLSLRARWTPAAACGGSAASSKLAPHSRGCSRSRNHRSWSRTWSARTRGATS